MKKQEDMLNTTDNVVLNYERFENTPFAIAKVQDGFRVLLGDNAVSEVFEKREDAYLYCHEIDWNKIIALVVKINKVENDN